MQVVDGKQDCHQAAPSTRHSRAFSTQPRLSTFALCFLPMLELQQTSRPLSGQQVSLRLPQASVPALCPGRTPALASATSQMRPCPHLPSLGLRPHVRAGGVWGGPVCYSPFPGAALGQGRDCIHLPASRTSIYLPQSHFPQKSIKKASDGVKRGDFNALYSWLTFDGCKNKVRFVGNKPF